MIINRRRCPSLCQKFCPSRRLLCSSAGARRRPGVNVRLSGRHWPLRPSPASSSLPFSKSTARIQSASPGRSPAAAKPWTQHERRALLHSPSHARRTPQFLRSPAPGACPGANTPLRHPAPAPGPGPIANKLLRHPLPCGQTPPSPPNKRVAAPRSAPSRILPTLLKILLRIWLSFSYLSDPTLGRLSTTAGKGFFLVPRC